MGYRVKIIKKHAGFIFGEEKNLSLGEARHLESKGIAKILERVNVDSLAVVVSELKKKVIAQGKEIAELKKLIPKK